MGTWIAPKAYIRKFKKNCHINDISFYFQQLKKGEQMKFKIIKEWRVIKTIGKVSEIENSKTNLPTNEIKSKTDQGGK